MAQIDFCAPEKGTCLTACKLLAGDGLFVCAKQGEVIKGAGLRDRFAGRIPVSQEKGNTYKDEEQRPIITDVKIEKFR